MNMKRIKLMKKASRLKLIKTIAEKIDRERKVAQKLAYENSVDMNEIETYSISI